MKGLKLLTLYYGLTFGMFSLTELDSSIVVRIVVMLRAVRAGIAVGGMKKVHQDRVTSMISGT